MDDEARGTSPEGRNGEPVAGGFSILLGEESIRAFMSSGDLSSARELDRFLELGARVEGRMTDEGTGAILALSVGENRLVRDFAVLQIAHVLAKHGRDVLIVDFDFISPGLSGLVENTEDQGFLDLLLYGSSLKTVEKPTGIDGVKVVGAGSFPVARTVPFAMKEFTKVRDFLSRTHDVTIYCSTLYTDDGAVNPLTRQVDSIFLSCRLEEMPEGQLQKNLADLGPGLPPADLVCFGEDGLVAREEEPAEPPVTSGEEAEPADIAAEEPSGEEEEYEPAAIEKTADLESGTDGGRGGMNLPRLVTIVVVAFVVIFLGWWFVIHRSISNKEGDRRTAELVQKQRDVQEMKARDHEGADGKAGQAPAAADTIVEEPAGAPDKAAAGDHPAEADEQASVEEKAGGEQAEDEKGAGTQPETATPAPAGSYYSIHVASFKEMSRAGKETDYLEKKGYETIVIAADVKGQEWYRVYVGEFGTKEEADAARLKLLDLPAIGYARVVTLKKTDN
jgi:cell division protein FtsN